MTLKRGETPKARRPDAGDAMFAHCAHCGCKRGESAKTCPCLCHTIDKVIGIEDK